MLDANVIERLASRPKVKSLAVANFLSTLHGLTYQEARGNMELDAQSYGWNRETQAAIAEGLLAHFFPK